MAKKTLQIEYTGIINFQLYWTCVYFFVCSIKALLSTRVKSNKLNPSFLLIYADEREDIVLNCQMLQEGKEGWVRRWRGESGVEKYVSGRVL